MYQAAPRNRTKAEYSCIMTWNVPKRIKARSQHPARHTRLDSLVLSQQVINNAVSDYKEALGHVCEGLKLMMAAIAVFVWGLYQIGKFTVYRITDTLTDE